jgi:hypothetical protein
MWPTKTIITHENHRKPIKANHMFTLRHNKKSFNKL